MDQITSQLSISNIGFYNQYDISEFDTIMSVCHSTVDAVEKPYEHVPLDDGISKNNLVDDLSANFTEAVDTLVSLLHDNKRVLIHCQAGQSRSVAVSIAALSVYKDIPYAEAYNLVTQKRHQANPDIDLEDFGRKYVHNHEKGSVMYGDQLE